MTWIEYIVKALENLGGLASYNDLYKEIERIRPEYFSPQWKATVRRTIETHSSHSANYVAGSSNIFYSVEGLGRGIWALRNYSQLDTPASDVEEPLTQYTTQTVLRIIRDSTLVHNLKRLYQYKCQICEHTIALNHSERYAEGHHVKPLGNPHNGPDIGSNIIVVCPNHHAELDFGAKRLDRDTFRILKHTVNQQYLDYHNQEIFPYR